MGKFNDEEKNQLIKEMANFIIEQYALGNKVSTRSVAQHFPVSHITVSDWMKYDLPTLFPDLYPEVSVILGSNRSLISDKKVQKRVLNIAKLVLEGYKYQDIIDYYDSLEDGYHLTDKMINHDLSVFLPMLDEKLATQVKDCLHERSLDNLTPGNDQAINQERNKNGSFK